ncbi:MAG: 50S ribosomal protein L11 methyltransferase [Cyanobacteria bacterium SBLK]|nr:50S ribosomal protein L11 methyltransferase [Cyanobacteria bacterium SBLK]
MYSLFGYGKMIADRHRMNAYVKALENSIQPGSIVLDLGTGTGISAMLACQLGAERVYAIESNPAIIVAKSAVKDNDFTNKIELIQELSVNVNLPEKVDLMISDLRGILPFFQQHIPAIVDARSRFLKEGGIMIPLRDRLWGTLVCAPELYRTYSSPWQDFPYNLNLKSARRFVLNSWQRCRITPEQCLLKPQLLTTLNYPEISTPNFQARLEWEVEQDGLVHGLCLWFDAKLVEGVEFSNAPGEPDLIYGQAFFPWLESVAIAAGDRIICEIKANLIGEKYIWQWHSQVTHKGEIKANFQQSTFNAQLLNPEALKRRSPDYIPQLNEEGKIVHFILSTIANASDRERDLEAISRQCATIFPERFPTWESALNRVRDAIENYSL